MVLLPGCGLGPVFKSRLWSGEWKAGDESIITQSMLLAPTSRVMENVVCSAEQCPYMSIVTRVCVFTSTQDGEVEV